MRKSTTAIAKHRQSVNGYPRGEETRARIVAAAMKLFGERGFEGASTRDIAAAAGVNAPALQYYFDNKEGVYRACLEHITDRAWDSMSEMVLQAERAVESGADDEALIEAYCALLAQGAAFKFKAVTNDDWRSFMARQQAGTDPDIGSEMVYRRVSRRIFSAMGSIVGRLTGLPADHEETMVRVLSLSGQLQIFQICRRVALNVLNWDAIDGERQALVTRIVCEQTRELLRALAATRRSNRSSRRRRRGSTG
jgi:AcrR family transcriptional regulator